MSVMIEKVAKEIFAIICPNVPYTGDDKSFYESRVAKAAIAAMREPTEEMIDELCDPGYEELMKHRYKLMIDAALKD